MLGDVYTPYRSVNSESFSGLFVAILIFALIPTQRFLLVLLGPTFLRLVFSASLLFLPLSSVTLDFLFTTLFTTTTRLSSVSNSPLTFSIIFCKNACSKILNMSEGANSKIKTFLSENIAVRSLTCLCVQITSYVGNKTTALSVHWASATSDSPSSCC